MKVTSLVFSTWQGLGILAKSFFDHGIITDPIVVRHGRRLENDNWFPSECPKITSICDPQQVEMVKDYLSKADVFLALETPFIWELFPFCQERGIKTVLLPNHECMPDPLPAEPDLILAPSLLEQEVYGRSGRHCLHIPVPVEVPWRQRTKAETFVHNAGHKGLKGRNGTEVLVESLKYVKSPIQLILRCQEPLGYNVKDCRVGVRIGTFPHEALFKEGDVFIFPTAFDGLSLPLQEARAAGMLVMTGDRFPANTWLPKEPLIPIHQYVKDRVSPRYTEFNRAIYNPKDIATVIDFWYGRDTKEYSEQGMEWAVNNSWQSLGPRYLEVLEGL